MEERYYNVNKWYLDVSATGGPGYPLVS